MQPFWNQDLDLVPVFFFPPSCRLLFQSGYLLRSVFLKDFLCASQGLRVSTRPKIEDDARKETIFLDSELIAHKNFISDRKDDFMDWKDSFNRNVLMQGWRRFQNHEMGPIMKNNNTYFVSSPEGYQTRAVIDNGYVDSISCSCFRGRRGELCEHEAALLFALENNASSSRKTPDAPSKSPSKENRQIPHPNAYLRPEASPFGRTSRPVKEAPQTSWSHPDGPAAPKVTPPSSDDSMPANPLLDELQKLFGLETPSAPIHPHEQAPKEEKPSAFEGSGADFKKPEADFKSSAYHTPTKPAPKATEPDRTPYWHPDPAALKKSGDEPFDSWSARDSKPESVRPEAVTETSQRPAPEKPLQDPEDEFTDPFERWMNAARQAQNHQDLQKPENESLPTQKQPEPSTFKAPERNNQSHPSWFWDPFHPDAKSPLQTQSKPESEPEKENAFFRPEPPEPAAPVESKPQMQPTAPDSSTIKITPFEAESERPHSQPAFEEKKPQARTAPADEEPTVRPDIHAFTPPAVKTKLAGSPEPVKEETFTGAPSKANAPKAESSGTAFTGIQTDKPYDFEALLQKLSSGDLSALLNAYGKMHPEFQDFILAGSLGTNPEAIGLIFEEAHIRLKACLLKDGSFQEREASRQARAFLSWLDDQLLALFASRQEASASDLLRNILNDLNESVRLDDELEANFLVHEIFSRLDHLLAGAPALVVKDTFSWMEDHLASPVRTMIDLPMLHLVEKPYFDREELALLKLNLLTSVLNQADDYSLSVAARHQLLNAILDLVNAFPQLEQSATSFMQTYGSSPQALLKKAHQAIEHNRPGLAQVQLKKARASTLSSSQEEEVCRLLIQIYQIEKQPDLAVRQLKELIFVLDVADPDDLALLKKLESDDEWAEDLKKLETTASPELLILVYDRLHLDDKLLAVLEKEPQIHDLIDYEDRLNAVDPDRTARLWLNAAHSIADQANERHDYHRLAAALRKAADHPSTHDEALQFAYELKEMNHRRKALIQELHHAGF